MATRWLLIQTLLQQSFGLKFIHKSNELSMKLLNTTPNKFNAKCRRTKLNFKFYLHGGKEGERGHITIPWKRRQTPFIKRISSFWAFFSFVTREFYFIWKVCSSTDLFVIRGSTVYVSMYITTAAAARLLTHELPVKFCKSQFNSRNTIL